MLSADLDPQVATTLCPEEDVESRATTTLDYGNGGWLLDGFGAHSRGTPSRLTSGGWSSGRPSGCGGCIRLR
ncbi:hypothetical protein GCM10009836_49860 [Pseudonocardia ailaonensis]|uniref:Uncharacterized protein n=1 Tax=Pseudonocardia ailaonensis TaxID=367279 RepID=A0ABN2NE35_9PSEU